MKVVRSVTARVGQTGFTFGAFTNDEVQAFQTSGFDGLCAIVCYLQDIQLRNGNDKNSTSYSAAHLGWLFGGSEGATALAEQACGSEYWAVRLFAAHVAGRRGGKGSARLLRRLARDPEAVVRLASKQFLAARRIP
jgi:hypothetical protein